MNGGKKKFGGGRVPTGTPSLAWSSVVVVASLLAGASIVHNIYKPDMVHPLFTHPTTPWACTPTVRRNAFLRAHLSDTQSISFFFVTADSTAGGGRGQQRNRSR